MDTTTTGCVPFNKQLLYDVVAMIEARPEQLDMTHFEPWDAECGTTACIGGHLALTDPEVSTDEPDWWDDYLFRERGAQRLGLTDEAVRVLFFDAASEYSVTRHLSAVSSRVWHANRRKPLDVADLRAFIDGFCEVVETTGWGRLPLDQTSEVRDETL